MNEVAANPRDGMAGDGASGTQLASSVLAQIDDCLSRSVSAS